MASFVLTGLSVTAERKVLETFPVQPNQLFDKSKFETYLSRLQNKPAQIFGDLPVHYDNVGHWLRTNPAKGTVDVLLDFNNSPEGRNILRPISARSLRLESLLYLPRTPRHNHSSMPRPT